MKTLQVGVHCKYWDRPEFVDIGVADDASDEEIERDALEAAVQTAGFEFWIDQKEVDPKNNP